jgi:hypothetical protein
MWVVNIHFHKTTNPYARKKIFEPLLAICLVGFLINTVDFVATNVYFHATKKGFFWKKILLKLSACLRDKGKINCGNVRKN